LSRCVSVAGESVDLLGTLGPAAGVRELKWFCRASRHQ